jgi:hypothetical protein
MMRTNQLKTLLFMNVLQFEITSLLPKAPLAAQDFPARTEGLRLKNCILAISHLRRADTIRHPEGVVKGRCAELPQFLYLPSNAVLCRALRMYNRLPRGPRQPGVPIRRAPSANHSQAPRHP